jgi:hypothetical protein
LRTFYFTQKIRVMRGFFGEMDLTGVAPVSPLVKGGILLHKLQAQVHPRYDKTKEAPYSRTPFVPT